MYVVLERNLTSKLRILHRNSWMADHSSMVKVHDEDVLDNLLNSSNYFRFLNF